MWKHLNRGLVVKLALLEAICLITTGCAKCPLSGSQFRGQYELINSDGKEYLQVFHDGTYSQKFDPSGGGPSLFRRGDWKYRADKDRLELRNYMPVDKRFSGGKFPEIVKKKWDAMLLLHCRGGKIIDIYFDEDYEVFRKVD